MPKITLSSEEIIDLIKRDIFEYWGKILDVKDPDEIIFNVWQINYGDFTFEKKVAPAVLEIKTPERTVYKEVKLEDVQDMVVEQMKAKGEQDAV